MTTEVKGRTLTPKQERFALFLFQGLSQREAYVKAGYSPNQLPDTLDRNACELAADSKIVTRLAGLRQEAENKAKTTVEERKAILSKIQRATFADFMDDQGNLILNDKTRFNTPAVSEIRTERTLTGTTTVLKLRDPVPSVAEHNKMERIGAVDNMPVSQDNRVLIINVNTDNAKSLINKLAGRLENAIQR